MKKTISLVLLYILLISSVFSDDTIDVFSGSWYLTTNPSTELRFISDTEVIMYSQEKESTIWEYKISKSEDNVIAQDTENEEHSLTFNWDSGKELIVDSTIFDKELFFIRENNYVRQEQWIENDYTDEWGDPTGEKYITGFFDGQYSGSGLTDFPCEIVIVRNNVDTYYMLFLGGSYVIGRNFGSTDYTISVKDEEGNKSRMYGEQKYGKPIISFNGLYENELALILSDSKSKVFIITNREDSSTYKFDYKPDGSYKRLSEEFGFQIITEN